jgi:uncharacterized membrane protein YgaE (UPF0421/DUF939 family)
MNKTDEFYIDLMNKTIINAINNVNTPMFEKTIGGGIAGSLLIFIIFIIRNYLKKKREKKEAETQNYIYKTHERHDSEMDELKNKIHSLKINI